MNGTLDGDGDRVAVDVRVAVGAAVTDADAPRDSVAVGVGDAVGVLLGVAHAKVSVWLSADVSLSDATVALLASSTRSVLLMARVSHVLAMPAAVHAAGGDQQPTICGLRLRKLICFSTVGVPRSTHQNSSEPDPPEL
jgi:hypothetical protein